MIDRHALGQLLAPSDTVVSIYLPLGGAEPPAPSALANGTAATGAQGLARCPARQLPLPRLLRLSLFQVSVGMALALLISALGRFAVIGTGVLPSWLIPLAIALPLFILPLRTVLCSHYYARGSDDAWQRVPYILAGTLLQFMGLAVMPFGLGLLSVTSATPALIGQASTLFAFILVAGGLHMVQAFGFRLATDLAPEDAHPRVVIVWFAMLLAGLAVSFLAFAALLANASGFALIQVIQSAAVLTMVVNAAALWRQVDYDRIAQSMQGSLLQAALHETEQSLAQRGVARPDIDALLYRARSLAIITAAARDHDRGLALFLRNGRSDAVMLPVAPPARVAVGTCCFIAPMLNPVAAKQRFYVLAIGKGTMRLFAATPFAFLEIRLPDLLSGQVAPDAVPSAVTPGATADEASSEDLPHIMRVRAALGFDPAPLILAGEPDAVRQIRSANHLPQLMAEALSLDPFAISREALHEVAVDVMQRSLGAELDAVLEQARAGPEQTGQLVAFELHDILIAAHKARVAALVVAEDKAQAATPAARCTTCDEDLLNEAAVLTLRNGGRAFSAPRALLPDQASAVALLRV